jgi:iron complex transport system substrate-binding protein
MTTSTALTWQTIRAISHNAPMRKALPFIAGILIVVSGCAPKKVVVAFRPKQYRAIISLSPGTTEIVASDGDTSTLKGRTSSCNFPSYIQASVPIVAAVKPDYERITSIHPDLIVYDKSLYSEQDIDKLKSSSTDMFAIDANTVDDFTKELYRLGSLIAAETHVNDYVNRIHVEEASAAASPISPTPKVAILMPSASGSDYIVGTDSFLADVVKQSGGQLVGPKSDNFGPVNAEAFVAMNPDVIVVPGSKLETSGPGLVANDPRFKSITAVKNGTVRMIESDVLLRRGHRVDQLIKALHTVINPANK